MRSIASLFVLCALLLGLAPRARADAPLAAQDWMASGRHKKRIGAVLMATGGVIAVVGTGLMIGGSWNGDHHCHGQAYYWYDGGCADDALTIAGATTTALGIGTIIPGIFVYVEGGSEIDAGRRLMQQCGVVCWPGAAPPPPPLPPR